MKCEKCGKKIQESNSYEHKSLCLCEDCYMDIRDKRLRKTHWRYIGSIKGEYLQPSKKQTNKKNEW